MPTSKSVYCFENDDLAAIFRNLHPCEYEVYSFKEYVSYLTSTKIQEASNLQKILSPLLDSTDDVNRYFHTINQLREALVLSSDDINFSFSHLPQTPLNKKLKNVMGAYFHLISGEDWAGLAWRAIEGIKNGHIFPQITQYVSTGSSFLFNEFIRSIELSNTEVSPNTIRLDRIENGDAETVPVIVGNDAWFLFAKRAARLYRRGKEVVLFFHGKQELLSLVTFYFENEKIPYETFRRSTCPSQSSFFKCLRGDRSIPIEKRLEWSRRLIKAGEYQPTESMILEKYFKEEPEDVKKKILNHLLTKEVPLSETEQTNKRIIKILPFFPIPLKDSQVGMAYFDETLFDFESDLLLTPWDTEILFREGFQVPRREAHRNLMKNFISRFTHRESNTRMVFTNKKSREVDLKRTLNAPSQRDGVDGRNRMFEVPVSINTISATQAELYSSCPAKYFFSNRLKLRKAKSLSDDLKLTFGQAVHLTLETVIGRNTVFDNRVLKDRFKEALKELRSGFREEDVLFFILEHKFEEMLPYIFQIEAKIESVFKSTQRLGVEKDFSFVLNGIRWTGKIDRLDESSNGKIVILDYKTGVVDFSPSHLKNGDHFQTLFYWLGANELYGKPIMAMLFYDLKKGELRRGVVSEECIDKEDRSGFVRGHVLADKVIDAHLDEGIERVKNLSNRMRDGDFTPTPSSVACEFCDYGIHCRSRFGNEA